MMELPETAVTSPAVAADATAPPCPAAAVRPRMNQRAMEDLRRRVAELPRPSRHIVSAVVDRLTVEPVDGAPDPEEYLDSAIDRILEATEWTAVSSRAKRRLLAVVLEEAGR